MTASAARAVERLAQWLRWIASSFTTKEGVTKGTMSDNDFVNGQNTSADDGKAGTQPDQTGVDTQALQDALANSQAKASEYLEGWQRSRAEFANFKKRVERDQSQVYQNAAGQIIKRYLEVLDDLERALKNRPKEGEGAVWANGIELVYRKLQTILENEGIQAMDSAGKQFDPTQHEAVTSEDSDQYESGQIIEVLQQGYTIGDKVLRPALVRVAR
jgi:molecular chaperone GrpE